VFFKTAIQFRSQLRARMGIFPYPIFASALVLSTGTRSGTPTRRPTLSGRETDGRRAPSGLVGIGCPSREVEIPLPTVLSPPQQHERGTAKRLYAAGYLPETLVRHLGAEDAGGREPELILKSLWDWHRDVPLPRSCNGVAGASPLTSHSRSD
jgi:hypothetical protein